MTVAWLGAKFAVPGDVTVTVQVPADVDVMIVVPLIKQGPASEIFAGAPEPVVANNGMDVFAATDTAPPAGHAALP